MQFWMYRDVTGQFRWYLQAANGKKVAVSGEGYFNRDDCIHAVNLVRGTNESTPFYEH